MRKRFVSARLQDQAGVPMTALDFLVCESGAMLWHVAGGLDSSDGTAKLMCDEEYERHMDFRSVRMRVLAGWTGLARPHVPFRTQLRGVRALAAPLFDSVPTRAGHSERPKSGRFRVWRAF
eukprot:362783-Chlamydomonas_euryale.AAC.4